jgi:carboxypeptidase Taq
MMQKVSCKMLIGQEGLLDISRVTLGNLYAASLFAVLRECFSDLEHRVEQGDFVSILNFLRERIHHLGHLYETPEILQKAVGARDHVADLLSYLRERYTDSYLERPFG